MRNTMEIEGYRAVIQFDPDIEIFRGEFVGLNGGADFYARDIAGLRREGAGGRHAQERRKYLRFQVLREVALSSRQALGLEPWGRMKVEYEGLDASLPWVQDHAHRLGISAERLREGVAGVLDYLRRERVPHDPEHEIFTKRWMEGDREIQQGYLPSFLAPNGTKLRREATEKPSSETCRTAAALHGGAMAFSNGSGRTTTTMTSTSSTARTRCCARRSTPPWSRRGNASGSRISSRARPMR